MSGLPAAATWQGGPWNMSRLHDSLAIATPKLITASLSLRSVMRSEDLLETELVRVPPAIAACLVPRPCFPVRPKIPLVFLLREIVRKFLTIPRVRADCSSPHPSRRVLASQLIVAHAAGLHPRGP